MDEDADVLVRATDDDKSVVDDCTYCVEVGAGNVGMGSAGSGTENLYPCHIIL